MNQPLSLDITTLSPNDGQQHVAASVREAIWINSVLQETRRRTSDAEAEQSRLAERLNSLMNALPAAVVVLDGSGRVVQCNPAAESLLQIPLQGRLWRELIGDLFSLQAAVDDVLQLQNGRLVTLSTRPLGSEPGQVLMLQDVTDTHQLRSRLAHSRRLADMGRMAASLAHQIRTPLASALLYVSQLHSSRLPEEKRERFVTKAMDSLKGLEKLIDDMLLFARDGQGERELLSVGELLNAVVLETQNHTPAVACSVAISNDRRSLLGNRVLLKSALQNLLNNAVEAGASHIRLQASCDASWCELSVADDGHGIAAEQQQRVFEPFVSGRSGGSGLGLAVVRAVVQSMGGEVRLESKPGEGSRFILRFPAVSQFNHVTAAKVAQR